MAMRILLHKSEPEIKVFVSHKKEDKPVALYVADYLKQRGLHAYIDVLDDSITSSNVTERIVANLRDSTHLIVIYSDNTKYSEWVPFELGVGYERNEGIGILKCDFTGRLPEYLHEFPVMEDEKDLDKFILLCKKPRVSVFGEACNDDAYGGSRYARQFITDLKIELTRGKYEY